MNFLDFLFPKKCVGCGQIGEYICASCKGRIEFIDRPVCPVCQRQAVGGKTHPGCKRRYSLDGLVVACRHSGPVKKAIQKVKYRWVFDIGRVLGDLLAANIWRFDSPGDLILVPIPLHLRRKKWRGFNQAELICQILGKKFGCRTENLLKRKVETKTQVGLTRGERKKNIKGAFALNFSVIRGKTIILVDDVYTTGATMAEACRVLKLGGASVVWGMAIALG